MGQNLSLNDDVICSVATAPAHGAIGIVRVSGLGSSKTVEKICSHFPESPETHRVYFTSYHKFKSPEEKIDEGLVTYFSQGKSYTGEESLELSYHGSPSIGETIIKELIKAGSRMARPGEFTFRAFMNNRIDLVQAEAVLDLVHSESEAQSRLSFQQLKGHLSKKFLEIEEYIIWLLSRAEASIDFSTEDIEITSKEEYGTVIRDLVLKIDFLTSRAEASNILKEGIRVCFFGHPNVGKSSIMNALLGEDRSIVSEEPGTTRDVVESSISVNGVNVMLLDTAGMRETESKIEKIGVEKAVEAVKRSDVKFYVIDSSLSKSSEELITIKEEINKLKPDGLILNKQDLVSSRGLIEKLSEAFPNIPQIPVSAKTGMGIESNGNSIRSFLVSFVQGRSSELSSGLIRARHLEKLEQSKKHILEASALIESNSSYEFIAEELQQALKFIYEILGKEYDDQVMDRVFNDFCLGK